MRLAHDIAFVAILRLPAFAFDVAKASLENTNSTHSSDDSPSNDSIDARKNNRKVVVNNESNANGASRSLLPDEESRSRTEPKQNLERHSKGYSSDKLPSNDSPDVRKDNRKPVANDKSDVNRKSRSRPELEQNPERQGEGHSSHKSLSDASIDGRRDIKKLVVNDKPDPSRPILEQNPERHSEGPRPKARTVLDKEPQASSLRRVLCRTFSISELLLAMLITLFLCWAFTYATTASMSGVSMQFNSFQPDICQVTSAVNQNLSQHLYHGLAYGSKLEEIQKVSADSVNLPLYLRLGEKGVRSMIIQLSSVDEPSRKILMPLLPEYHKLVDKAIANLHVWITLSDSIVDASIITKTWARSHLGKIQARNSSTPFPFNTLVGFFMSSPDEAEVRAVLSKMAKWERLDIDKLHPVTEVEHKALTNLKDALIKIAEVAFRGSEKVEIEKLTEESYWKWIFRSHKDKVPAFDARMQMCAKYYMQTERALTAISLVQSKIIQISAELLVFQSWLKRTPAILMGDKTSSLQLYRSILKAWTRRLTKSRDASRLLRDERERKFDESVTFEYDELPDAKYIVGNAEAVRKFQRQVFGEDIPGVPYD
ncbi:hypothetical protein MMC11_000833 [Xylographa trunciseda]|nr:hypothetical protein [Xylographa trunciseda]